MTLFYPDVSGHNSGISTKGAPAVACKVTEGDFYLNPDYARAKADAAANKVFFFAYHFLHAGNGAGQADFCFQHCGKTPLMLDVEPTGGSAPTPTDVLAFMVEFTRLGGIVHLFYFPHWYWQRLGSPDLTPLSRNGLLLVSSNYTSYSDSGPGWAAYGGVTPTVWQYTDQQPFNGQNVDFNAYKGSLADLESIVSTGHLPAPPPPSQTPGTLTGPVKTGTGYRWTASGTMSLNEFASLHDHMVLYSIESSAANLSDPDKNHLNDYVKGPGVNATMPKGLAFCTRDK